MSAFRLGFPVVRLNRFLGTQPARLWFRRRHCNSQSRIFPRIHLLRTPKCIGERVVHTSSLLAHGEYEWQDPKSEDEVVNISVIDAGGNEHKIRGKIGDNVLYLAHRFGVDMEGACEASLACTTCHVYVEDNLYEKLPEPLEEEEDLLDLAPQLSSSSRLGCQIILSENLEGMRLRLPKVTRNFYVDGFKPQPH
nr:mitochondrial ferredoxin-2 [Halisarca dujardinii]